MKQIVLTPSGLPSVLRISLGRENISLRRNSNFLAMSSDEIIAPSATLLINIKQKHKARI